MAFYVKVVLKGTNNSRWAKLLPPFKEKETDRVAVKAESWDVEVTQREMHIPSESWDCEVRMRELRISRKLSAPTPSPPTNGPFKGQPIVPKKTLIVCMNVYVCVNEYLYYVECFYF